jgi:hypothetical protein
MKLTTARLKRLIREELSKLNERERSEAEQKAEGIIQQALTNLEMINLNTGYGRYTTDDGGQGSNVTTIYVNGKEVAAVNTRGGIQNVKDLKIQAEITKLMKR